MSDRPDSDADATSGSDSIPPEFERAESVSEVYAQVFAINAALQQVVDAPSRESIDEERYESAAFEFLNTDLDDLTERVEAAIDAVERNMREVVAHEHVESYTISLTGGVNPSITLDVTYTPAENTNE